MEKKTSKICKYPKCKKEVPKETNIFCSEHAKKVKEIGGIAVGATGAIVSLIIQSKSSE